MENVIETGDTDGEREVSLADLCKGLPEESARLIGRLWLCEPRASKPRPVGGPLVSVGRLMRMGTGCTRGSQETLAAARAAVCACACGYLVRFQSATKDLNATAENTAGATTDATAGCYHCGGYARPGRLLGRQLAFAHNVLSGVATVMVPPTRATVGMPMVPLEGPTTAKAVMRALLKCKALQSGDAAVLPRKRSRH